jgi:hypothetical protein
VLESRWCRGALGRKTPCRSSFSGGGVSTRAAWNHTHTARLEARRRIHCSAPHCKGYCHTDRPIRKPWASRVLHICMCHTAAWVSRAAEYFIIVIMVYDLY